MNQLIIIIIILRNWLRPFSASILKFVGCIIALIISFAIYKQYNSIQSQQISIYCETSSNLELYSGYNLYVSLDYSQSENKTLWDNIDLQGEEQQQIIGNYIKYSGLRIPKDTINAVQRNEYIANEHLFGLNEIPHIKEILPDSVVGYTLCSVFFNYEDNSWFMPRMAEPVRDTSMKPTILSIDSINDHITINTLSELRKEFVDSPEEDNKSSFLGWRIGRKKRWYYLESLGFFNYPDSGNIYNNSDCVFRQKIICPERFYAPKFYSAYDVSKLNLKVYFSGDSLNEFTLGFRSPADFSEIHPDPDYKDCLSITFTDKEKLNYIKENGLRLFVTFYETESLQDSRNYILSALITLFLTLVATIGWTLFKNLLKHKQRINNVAKSINQSHPKYYVHFSNIILLLNIVIITIISIIIIICNPYDWSWIESLCFYIIIVGLIFFVRRNQIPLNEKTPITIRGYICKIFIIGLVLIIIGLGIQINFQFINKIADPNILLGYTIFISSLLIGSIICFIIKIFRSKKNAK